MTRTDTMDWRRRRRGVAGRSFRGGWIWGMTTLVVLSGAAMGVVWQKVRFEGVALRYADRAREHSRLVSELEAERFEFQSRATRATLIPRAVKLGLFDVPTDDILLVAFPDADAQPSNPLFDGIVGQALAADKNPSADRQRINPSPGARDGQ